MSKLRPSKENTKDFSFKRWMDGEDDPYIDKIEMIPQYERKEEYTTLIKHMKDYEEIEEKLYDPDKNKVAKLFNILYKCSSAIFIVLFMGLLIFVVSYLPPEGNATNPVNNEVAERYITEGLQETGTIRQSKGFLRQ